MSILSRFMKQNKTVKENTIFAATKSLTDEKGEPLLWEIRHIPTKEDEKIRDACTVEVPVTGKPGMYRPKVNSSKYISKLLAESVVFPDLCDAALQDSYGVKTPEDLILEMLDDTGEYMAFTAFVQKFNGFNVSIDEKIDEAKN